MKQHRLKNRTEKIKFLKRLQTGMANMTDLYPLKIRVWRFDRDKKTYENPPSGKKLSEAEYHALTKGNEVISIKLNS